jgi:hypothetical protein
MKPASSSLWTSAFTASIFSSDILRSFCFLGFMFGLTYSLCSIISLLTPNGVEGGPHKSIIIFVKESQELRLFFRTCLSAEADSSVKYLGIKCNFLKITLSFDVFFEFCRSFLFDGSFCLLILFCFFPYEVYVFVARSEALLYVSGILLTAKYWYDAKGGWDLKAEIP